MCLGLNNRSPHVAARNELGRLSLKLQITMNILKFWIHLENQPPDSIAKLCLNISDKMAQENKSGLKNKINLLCAQLNINKKSVNFRNPSAFLSKAENNLSVHLKNHQLNLISTNKKLTFYSIFENETKYSDSLIMLRILNINVSPPNLGLEIITVKNRQWKIYNLQNS